MDSKTRFLKKLSKVTNRSTFMSIIGYKNSSAEIADYSIIYNVDYKELLNRSIKKLQSLYLTEEENIAREEIISSFRNSIKNIESADSNDPNYDRLLIGKKYLKGVKLHKKSGIIYICGIVVHKKVTIPGFYKKSSDSKKLAKTRLRDMCPVSKFRQFKITVDQIDHISVQNISLLPPRE